jgi:RNA polymerase-binding transcription factor DksA
VHYRYLTLEQRDSLERLMRSGAAGDPGLALRLQRLHSPQFGVCEACGADIPYVQLLRNPNVLRCTTCQEGT